MATLEPFFYWYIASWMLACLAALVLYLRQPKTFSIATPEYRDYLFVPWKLGTFAVAAIGLTIIAPYTGDPTWDYFDALFMSLLTFWGAPWVIGVVFLVVRGRLPAKQLYVALCLWMFSVSWSYDFYLVLRDGRYPDTWLPNIAASSVFYISAGLMWNLDWLENRGMTFSFLEKDWPTVMPVVSFAKVFWYASPFILMAAGSVLYFLFLTHF